MNSDKQKGQNTFKGLSEMERTEALKWVDSLSQKELKEFEHLNKIELTKLLIEKYFKSKTIYWKKCNKK